MVLLLLLSFLLSLVCCLFLFFLLFHLFLWKKNSEAFLVCYCGFFPLMNKKWTEGLMVLSLFISVALSFRINWRKIEQPTRDVK